MKSVSLFSGCGGLDLGLLRAGFDVVLAVEKEHTFADSYVKNFPTARVYRGPIEELTVDDMQATAGVDALRNVALLAGGPPCPPFSKSRFYRKDAPRALEDPVALGTISGYLTMLRELQPRAFILENVPGLAYKVHRDALETIQRDAEVLGYHCAWRILNAADYGVPQRRERFFMVGMLDREFVFPTPTHRNPCKPDLLTEGREPWVTAGDAIADLDTEENADDTGHVAGGKDHHLLEQVPPGDNYLYFTKERGFPEPIFRWRSRYWSFLLKLSPEMPSWTIQARRSNNMGPFHWRSRILRIEEVKRLQSFPDDWDLLGTTEQQWRQLGNAVPPLLAEHLGVAIRQQLSE